MSTETYLTQERDTVDLIAWNQFGRHGMEPAILDANPGLAAHGPFLPAGLSIVIPRPEMKDRTELENIWS